MIRLQPCHDRDDQGSPQRLCPFLLQQAFGSLRIARRQRLGHGFSQLLALLAFQQQEPPRAQSAVVRSTESCLEGLANHLPRRSVRAEGKGRSAGCKSF